MHRFKLFLLIFVLMTLGVGFWSRVGAALLAKVPEVRNWKFVTGRAPASRTPRTGSVLWSADMETGDLSQWSLPDVLGGPTPAAVSLTAEPPWPAWMPSRSPTAASMPRNL